jgi:hypothetical protein
LPVIRPNEGELSSDSFYLEATKNMSAAKKLMPTSVPKAQPDETVGVALEWLCATAIA